MVGPSDLLRLSKTADDQIPLQSLTTRRPRLPLGLTGKSLLKGFIGLSLPAAILGAALPAAQPVAQARIAPAAAYALAGTAGAFGGDVGLSDAALADLAAGLDLAGTLEFGAPATKPAAAKVSTAVANLRSGPGLAYDKIGKLRLGTTVTLLERTSDWLHVRTGAGAKGWVALELLDVASGTIEQLAVAKKLPAKPAAAKANAAPAKPAAAQARTNDTGVNLRNGPSTRHEVLGAMPKGTRLVVLGRKQGWINVRTPAGKVGWVMEGFITGLSAVPATAPAKPAAPSTATAPKAKAPAASVAAGIVSQSRTNLRQGPGTAHASLMKLGARIRLKLVARHGDWFKVTTPKGATGWVLGELLEVDAATARTVPVTDKVPAAPPARVSPRASTESAIPGSSRGAQAARIALQHVGSRYVWGGASPRGFDCSGLVLYAYKQVGLRLPHKAKLQFSTRYGTRINNINALKVGDIVFFANTAGRGITHVAIYVGNGRMVTANSRRTGVLLQSIHTRYWRSHFAGAIRPS